MTTDAPSGPAIVEDDSSAAVEQMFTAIQTKAREVLDVVETTAPTRKQLSDLVADTQAAFGHHAVTAVLVLVDAALHLKMKAAGLSEDQMAHLIEMRHTALDAPPTSLN